MSWYEERERPLALDHVPDEDVSEACGYLRRCEGYTPAGDEGTGLKPVGLGPGTIVAIGRTADGRREWLVAHVTSQSYVDGGVQPNWEYARQELMARATKTSPSMREDPAVETLLMAEHVGAPVVADGDSVAQAVICVSRRRTDKGELTPSVELEYTGWSKASSLRSDITQGTDARLPSSEEVRAAVSRIGSFGGGRRAAATTVGR